MPPKRNNRGKQKEKQKKQIETRLMQIMMKMDSYIYRNRPISASDARAYIDEVSEYKTQCAGDTRFLQVIEKLFRCMKSIIAEQEQASNQHEATNSNQQATNNEPTTSREYIASPVYSLPDEDRTLLTQNILPVEGQDILVTAPVIKNLGKGASRNENPVSKQTDMKLGLESLNDTNSKTDQSDFNGFKNNGIEASLDIFNNTDHIDNNFDGNSKKTVTINENIEIIDLCDDNDDLNDSQAPNDVEMHRALSNLSLRDTEQVNADFECSQSILTGYETDRACTLVDNENQCITKETPVSVENLVYKKPLDTYAKKGLHKTEVYKKGELKNNRNQTCKGNINTPTVNEEIVRNITETINKNPVNLAFDTSVKHNVTKLDAKKQYEKHIKQRVPNIEMTEKNNEGEKQIKRRWKIPLLNNNVETKIQIEEINTSQLINIPITPNYTEMKNKECTTSINNFYTNIKNDNSNVKHNVAKLDAKNEGEKQIKRRKKRVPNIEKTEKINEAGKQIKRRGKIPRQNKNEKTKIQAEEINKSQLVNIPITQNHTEMKNTECTTSISKSKLKDTNIKNENNKTNKTMPKIYTTSVIDDLSWVENIRYVREIASDEYDKQGCLGNDFWENFTLPPNLDNKDFNDC